MPFQFEKPFRSLAEASGELVRAAPVRRKDEATIAVITIAGQLVRLSQARMLELAPELLKAAAELDVASNASPMVMRPVTQAKPKPAKQRPVGLRG
jgi:hypothetical protein